MFKQKLTIEVDDWDELVQETYGRPYSFQQQDDCKYRGVEAIYANAEDDFENDTVPEEINGTEMGVSFKAWLARDPEEWSGTPEDKRHLDLFWSRNFYPSPGVLAADLFKRGLIPSEQFTINIDW